MGATEPGPAPPQDPQDESDKKLCLEGGPGARPAPELRTTSMLLREITGLMAQYYFKIVMLQLLYGL